MIEDFSEVLVDAFYANETPRFDDLAYRSGLSVAECERQWRALQNLSLTLAHLKVVDVSPIVLNRLSVLAREAVAPQPSFWQKFLAPRWLAGFAVVALVTVLGVRVAVFEEKPAPKKQIAQNMLASPLMTERLFKTTLDQMAGFDGSSPKVQSRDKSQNKFSLASPVSLGNTESNTISENLFKTNLNAKEVQSLYFRARKFEQQGYLRDALKDYQFLAEFYPQSLPPQSLHLAMARCLEGLGQDEAALQLLKKSANRYGTSEDLQMMIEELKSQTF